MGMEGKLEPLRCHEDAITPGHTDTSQRIHGRVVDILIYCTRIPCVSDWLRRDTPLKLTVRTCQKRPKPKRKRSSSKHLFSGGGC